MSISCHFNLFLEQLMLQAVHETDWFQRATKESQLMLEVDLMHMEILPAPMRNAAVQKSCIVVRAMMPRTIKYLAIPLTAGIPFGIDSPSKLMAFRIPPTRPAMDR